MFLNNYSFSVKLFCLFFISLTFDSFPFGFLNSVYKPLTIIPIILIFLLSFKKSFFFISKKLVYLFIFLILTSFFNSVFINKYDGFLKFTFEIVFIISAVHCLNFTTRNLSLNDLKRILAYLSSKIVNLLIFVGFIQFFGRFNNFFNQISYYLNSIFIYRHDESRIQFFSGEPSMGVRVLIFFLIVSYISDKKKSFLQLILAFSLIVLSGSTFGILFLVILAIVYFFLSSTNRTKFFFKSLFFVLIFFLLFNIFVLYAIDLMPNYTQNKFQILISIYENFTFEGILKIASIDGSFFLRVFNPIIGFQVFAENPIIGVGGENFKYYYVDLIQKNYPFALNFPTVNEVYQNSSQITPKSMISKIMSEFGLIGLIIIIYSYKKILNYLKKDRKLIILGSFIVAMSINYDGYIYLPMIFFFFLLKKYYKINNEFV